MVIDYFSKQSAFYAKYRPLYPTEFFERLRKISPGGVAWDCATGNGQGAIGLGYAFDKVEATDISTAQIDGAFLHPKVNYTVAPASNSGFPNDHFDLISVAQAVHWLDTDEFYPEIVRVAKPGAVVAFYGYSLARVNPAFNELLDHFYSVALADYWDPRLELVNDRLQTLPFPFEEIKFELPQLKCRWTETHIEGYLNSWSGVQSFKDKNGVNPVEGFMPKIRAVLPLDSFDVEFPLFARVGIVRE